jgi:glutaminyl-tRNA synthetase
MAVLDPVKLVIENYPEGQIEWMDAINNPEDPSAGTRKIPFSRELYIESDDFREEAPKKFFRLAPGREVRLRYGYLVTCTGFSKDPQTGRITEIRCSYDPDTRGGNAPDGRKVKGTIHWVAASHAVPAEVRIYDRLFKVEHPDDVLDGVDYKTNLNTDSLKIVRAFVEPQLALSASTVRFQFERKGYFFQDLKDFREEAPVYNQIVPLKDSGSKPASPDGN